MKSEISQTELVLIVPVLEGKGRDIQELASTLSGPKRGEYEISQRNLGITKEAWFMQKSPQGDFVIVYVEGSDVAKSLGKLISSRDAFDDWIKNEVGKITGVDFNNPPRTEPLKEILRYGY